MRQSQSKSTVMTVKPQEERSVADEEQQGLTSHCMSDLCHLECCCRGMGSATVSHPEVADDKCSAALDIPKVASLITTLCAWDSHCTGSVQMCRTLFVKEA